MALTFSIFNQIFEFSPEDDEAYIHFKAFFTHKGKRTKEDRSTILKTKSQLNKYALNPTFSF